ncbi:MAG: hypothetical protein M3O36_11080 [Myxococcota bacterium]|nr:hypothetical protein [Myxococcota bacterium]
MNRTDLHIVSRFVFGLFESGAGQLCTIIFEYRLPTTTPATGAAHANAGRLEERGSGPRQTDGVIAR